MTENISIGYEYDSDWVDAIDGIVEGLKFDGIHYSNREEIIRRSFPVWEEYMICKRNLGPSFAELSVEDKLKIAATILLGLSENPDDDLLKLLQWVEEWD